MSDLETAKVLQIIPAPGWYVTGAVNGNFRYLPLVGWALIEDGQGHRSVEGLVAGPEGVIFARLRIPKDTDYVTSVELADILRPEEDEA